MENRDFNKNLNIIKIPSNDVFFSKKINDLLYASLIIKSFKSQPLGDIRITNRDKLTIRGLAEEVYNDERKKDKISKDLKKLEEFELIKTIYPKEYRDKNYQPIFLQFIDFKSFVPILQPVLESFVAGEVEGSLKVFSYLAYKNATVRNNEFNYTFTIDEILTNCFQLKSTTNAKQRKEVNEILNFLTSKRLIEISKIKIKYNGKLIQKFNLDYINTINNKTVF